MKHEILLSACIAIPSFLLCISGKAEERHAETIIADILGTRQAILDNAGADPEKKLVFLAFWDFDGTILKGDCSEGLKEGNRTIYKGLVQLAIESGYSRIYRPDGGFDRFWKDYRHLEETVGKWLAYPFLPQILRGSKTEDVSRLAENQFSGVFRQYYFKSSMEIIRALEEKGIRNHVISASADVFVDAAAPTLDLPRSRFNGIEVRAEGGRLTEKLVYPVTWADGKTEKLNAIVKGIQSRDPSAEVIVLAAFGNSYGTDGSFMRHVASQALPAGKPLAVMINGGTPPKAYQGMFREVRQSAVSGNQRDP